MEPVAQCEDQGSIQRCALHYRCISDGTAHLTITLPLLHLHQGVEFAYTKQCRKPKIAVTEEVVTDSTVYVLGVTIGLLALWVCTYWQGGKSPLKSTELTRVPI